MVELEAKSGSQWGSQDLANYRISPKKMGPRTMFGFPLPPLTEVPPLTDHFRDSLSEISQGNEGSVNMMALRLLDVLELTTSPFRAVLHPDTYFIMAGKKVAGKPDLIVELVANKLVVLVIENKRHRESIVDYKEIFPQWVAEAIACYYRNDEIDYTCDRVSSSLYLSLYLLPFFD